GVLLEVVPLAGDVGSDFDAARQAHACDLAQSRVRLLGRGRVDARAYAAALRARLESRGLALRRLGVATLPDELLNRRHYFSICIGENCDCRSDPRARACRTWFPHTPKGAREGPPTRARVPKIPVTRVRVKVA